MNFRPFYIKYESWMTDKQVAEVFDKAVAAGGNLYEGVEGIHTKKAHRTLKPEKFEYFGIDASEDTYFLNHNHYGRDASLLLLDQVDGHLGIKTSPNNSSVLALRNVKINLLEEDGRIDEDKSYAFQKAVFETGGKWSGAGGTDVNNNSGWFYLYVDAEGKITWGRDNVYFENKSNTEVDFQYETITTWTATVKEKKETIEIDGEVYLKEDVIKALSSLKKVGE